MTFRTLHDRILLKRDEAPKKTKGGLAIPDSSQKPPDRGEVLAVGKPLDVQVGERVLFQDNGTEIVLDGEKRILLKEVDIYGVLENDTLRPIGSKVLILPDPPKEMEGLIHIPKGFQKERRDQERLVSGTVVAMGKGMRTKTGGRWPMPDVKIGQRVLFYHAFTPELEIGGKAHVVVADDLLRAVFEDEEKAAE